MTFTRQPSLQELLTFECVAAAAAGLDADAMNERVQGFAAGTVHTTLSRLTTLGVLFAGGPRRRRRYFAEKAFATAWDAEHSTEAMRKRLQKIAAEAKPPKAKPSTIPKGVRSNGWSDEHLAMLMANYPALGAQHVANITGRSVSSVQHKARELGVRCEVYVPKLHRENKPKHKKQVQKPKAAPVVTRKAGSSIRIEASPPKRGPAYLEGPLIFNDQTRRVVCPSPPRPTRTNTYATA